MTLKDAGGSTSETADVDLASTADEGASAFEQGRAAGDRGGSAVNPFENGTPDHHHFETGRKFGSRGNRSGASSYWQRRKG